MMTENERAHRAAGFLVLMTSRPDAPGLARTAMAMTLATLLVACGCATEQKKPPPEPPRKSSALVAASRPLCMIETAASVDKAPRDRTFPAQNWFVLLLHAYRSTGEIARPLIDCSGVPVKIDDDACGSRTPPRFIPTQLTSRDVVVTSLGDTQRLVWVITERLPDGMAQGPIAIAEIEPRGISARALGVLRAYSENVSLRLERVSGATLLVADGQYCPDSRTPETCERAIRMVPLVGNRFIQTPLVDSKGGCLGSTFLPVRAKGQTGKQTGRYAGTEYELETSVTFAANIITIREHLALSRSASNTRNAKDTLAESFVTRLQQERQVALHNGWLVTDGPSLLTRWLRQQDANRE